MADHKAADTPDTAKAIELLRTTVPDKPMTYYIPVPNPRYADLVECFAAAARRKTVLDKMLARAMQGADLANNETIELSKELDAAEDDLDTAIAKVCKGVLGDG